MEPRDVGDERLNALEATNGRLKKWLACVTAWLVITWLWPLSTSSQPPVDEPAATRDKLIARNVVVVNEQGEEMLELYADSSGGGLRSRSNQGAMVDLSASREIAELRLRHHDKDATLRAWYGGGSELKLMDKHFVVDLHADIESEIEIRPNKVDDAQDRFHVYVGPERTGTLRLFGHDKKVIWEAGGREYPSGATPQPPLATDGIGHLSPQTQTVIRQLELYLEAAKRGDFEPPKKD